MKKPQSSKKREKHRRRRLINNKTVVGQLQTMVTEAAVPTKGKVEELQKNEGQDRQIALQRKANMETAGVANIQKNLDMPSCQNQERRRYGTEA